MCRHHILQSMSVLQNCSPYHYPIDPMLSFFSRFTGGLSIVITPTPSGRTLIVAGMVAIHRRCGRNKCEEVRIFLQKAAAGVFRKHKPVATCHFSWSGEVFAKKK